MQYAHMWPSEESGRPTRDSDARLITQLPPWFGFCRVLGFLYPWSSRFLIWSYSTLLYKEIAGTSVLKRQVGR